MPRSTRLRHHENLARMDGLDSEERDYRHLSSSSPGRALRGDQLSSKGGMGSQRGVSRSPPIPLYGITRGCQLCPFGGCWCATPTESLAHKHSYARSSL